MRYVDAGRSFSTSVQTVPIAKTHRSMHPLDATSHAGAGGHRVQSTGVRGATPPWTGARPPWAMARLVLRVVEGHVGMPVPNIGERGFRG